MSDAQSPLILGRDESPGLKCKDRELQGILKRTPLTPPITLPTHLLCQRALPSHALPADMLGWEEIINSQELVSSPCVHTPSYIPYSTVWTGCARERRWLTGSSCDVLWWWMEKQKCKQGRRQPGP